MVQDDNNSLENEEGCESWRLKALIEVDWLKTTQEVA